MKSKNKKRFLTVGLYAIFVTSLTGSICGTLAWYTYGTRVPVGYNGVSIGDYGSLEIGIRSKARIPEAMCVQYALDEDTSLSGTYIYWCTGSFPAETMKYVMQLNGYSYQYLHACTAGSYSEPGDEFRLRNNPTYLKKYFRDVENAPKDDYIKLDLVFRYRGDSEEGSEEIVYADDYDVYLAQATPISDSHIHEGLRMYIEPDVPGISQPQESGYLINPSKEKTSTIIAGGPLDLNNDGYYDTYKKSSSINDLYEFSYGELLDEDVKYFDSKTSEETYDYTESSTFYANSKEGVYRIDQDKTVYPTISFLGYEYLTKKKFVIAKPHHEVRDYAFCSITVYLEGWDRIVDNIELQHFFTFELLFEATLNEKE